MIFLKDTDILVELDILMEPNLKPFVSVNNGRRRWRPVETDGYMHGLSADTRGSSIHTLGSNPSTVITDEFGLRVFSLTSIRNAADQRES